MTHDPLCPFKAFIPAKIKGKPVDYQNWDSEFMDPPKPTQYYVRCQCDLIAKVRADEKAKWTHICPDNNCCHGSPE